MPTILVLIPAYNEARRVGEVVRAAAAQLPVLVVDDGSGDETGEIARGAGAQVLTQQPNQGKGAALIRGFRHALDEGYDAVIALDADGQHAPEELGKFVQAFEERGGDLIIGSRDFSQMPLVRRLSNTLGTWIFSWAVGQPVRDNQSGYRLLSARMMQACLAGEEAGFEFELEQIALCMERGYRLDWVPIRTIYEGETSHIRPVEHVVRFVQVSLALRRRLRS